MGDDDSIRKTTLFLRGRVTKFQTLDANLTISGASRRNATVRPPVNPIIVVTMYIKINRL